MSHLHESRCKHKKIRNSFVICGLIPLKCTHLFSEEKEKKRQLREIAVLILEQACTVTRARANARAGSSIPELTTRSHCTSVRVSVDDKWRASQSKPICTSIRRGAKWGSTCIFLPAEKPYISAKTLPRGDGIRGRQRGEGGSGAHSAQILGGVK